MLLAWPSRDGKFSMIIDAAAPSDLGVPFPAYAWIGLAALLFCYILAVQFACPLPSLSCAVMCFTPLLITR